MRDMLTEDDDDEEDDHHRYENSSSHHHHHATQQNQRPPLSSDDFPAVSSSSKINSKATDDSALPASASWAKIGANSTPSTPVLGVSDAFGPTLSAAVAASQQKTQFPPMPKRKSEKKKRKEQLQQQKSTPDPSSSQPATPKSAAATVAPITLNEGSKENYTVSNSPSSSVAEAESQQQQQRQQSEEDAPTAATAATATTTTTTTTYSVFDQGLTGFVLGQAYKDLCPLPTEAEFESKQRQDDQAAEELTLGVSALLLDDDTKAEPSPAQRNLEAIQLASTSKLIPSTIPSVLDFLTYSTPTPKYTGLFNPFSHMNMLGGQQHPNNGAAALLNNNLDSPIRRHSRFGFAQA